MKILDTLRNALKSGVVNFKYTKKDGSVREAKGTLNPEIIGEKYTGKDKTTIIVTEENLMNVIGYKTCSDVIMMFKVEYTDMDTNETVFMERQSVVLPKDTTITKEIIPEILESGVENLQLYKPSKVKEGYTTYWDMDKEAFRCFSNEKLIEWESENV